ncbi:MAG: 30S ribosomal protein S6 [Planctomycetes bacterium]|nr:30S ribosomal protein S6 [Planctomycetota bacterium]
MSNSKTYEGMFLVQSGSDFHAASQPVNTVLERSDAEILSINPWEERRLAYEIKGHKRGLYILTYFKMDPANLSELHRDSELNEGILRMMILRRDKITDQEINAETPASASRRQAADAEDAAAQGAAIAEPPATPEMTPVAEDAAPTDVPVVEEAPAVEEQASPEADAPADEETPVETDVTADIPAVEEAPVSEEQAPAEADAPVDEEARNEAFVEADAPVEAEIIEPDAEPKASDEA